MKPTECDVDGCDRPVEDVIWCHAHYERQRRGDPLGGPILDTPAKRFWARVDQSGDCWIWLGSTSGGGRYGRFGGMQAHAWSYIEAGGTIPEGWDIDHLCRTTLCVRPDHLEAVTHRENILRGNAPTAINARKTHCKRGHELAGDNVRWFGKDRQHRACRACEPLMPSRQRRAAA